MATIRPIIVALRAITAPAVAAMAILFAMSTAQCQAPDSSFIDNFQRPDSAQTGNGWIDTSVGYGPIGAGISHDRQYMISNNNGQPITYRTDITQTSGIVIKGEFSSINLTDGYYKVGLLAADGYRDSGYSIVFGAQSPQKIYIGDNSGALVSAPFAFNNGNKYAFEWHITAAPQNWAYLYVWNADAGNKPAVPTLVWTNGGNNYSPTVSGNRFYFTSGLQGLVQPTETMYSYFFEVDKYVPPFMTAPLRCGNPACTFNYTKGAYTPGTINTVLDHSLKKNQNGFWQYGTTLGRVPGGDGKIIGFTGEEANGLPLGHTKEKVVCIRGTISLNGLANTFACGSGFASYDEHPGYDYLATFGTPVYAVAGGTVVSVTNNKRFGLEYCYDTYLEPTACVNEGWVGIDHGNGYISQYGHLEKIYVVPGQNIKQGDKIGLSGNRGLEDLADCMRTANHCAHLHFEVIKIVNGELFFVDPYGWSGSGPDPLYCPDPTNCVADRPASTRLWK
ncbi:MAG TPA: M23 family metallopeptidase [Xanthobacteraceae bacterium]|jgi:hypothetical protein|nr:M23 family metallopeptidase [Xanthobacteraceae bacterium]